jgi:hypothetical protein
MGLADQEAVDELLRNSPLDLGGEVREQRQVFEEMVGPSPGEPTGPART